VNAPTGDGVTEATELRGLARVALEAVREDNLHPLDALYLIVCPTPELREARGLQVRHTCRTPPAENVE
jgi:hypothetical protein